MVNYKEYQWRDLPKLLHRVTKTVAMVMMVIGFAAGFGYLMAIMQLPAKATQLFLHMTDNKYAMLMLVNVLLLLLGTFMDMAPMRSEEHTSELQSLRHLVCRLLLEKK